MDRDRFAVLVDAYGAAPHRWPETERDAALALLRRDPSAERLLERAGALDDRLDAHRVGAPSPALAAAVLRRAPTRATRRLRRWWAGLGAVAVGLGGMAAGTAAGATLLPALVQPADPHEDLTAFGGGAAEEER